jgi:D-alanyl-D-alanine-carboxypeptidase/D-alanyl-D-alanine-endopeptidase
MASRLRLRRVARIAVLATAFPFGRAAAQQLASDDEISKILALRVASGKNPSIVVGIYENGKTRIIPMGASGSPNQALDGNTVFEIGSITKVFTSTLLADMVARGLVAYDDSARKYLPANVRVPSRNGRPITLVDLATQHSALPRMPDNLTPADRENPYADYTPAQMYDFLSRYTLPRDPGERFEYSNLGVGLLGHVLALRAGTSYEALVIDRILGPLGMRDTRITLTPNMRAQLAQAYDAKGFPTKNWDLPTLAGAGALRSTANDMLRFAAAALGAPGTPPAVASALAEAERPRRDLPGPGKSQIGLNWFTSNTGPVEIVWHNGGTGGYRTFLGLDKAHHRAVVVLATANSPDDIGRHILDPSLPLATIR